MAATAATPAHPAPMPAHRRYGPAIVVVAAAAALAAGLFLPCVEFRKFFFIAERHSLAGIVVALIDEGEYFLGVVLGLFSVVFPVMKLAVLAWIAAARALGRPAGRRAAGLAAAFGRWSMLDVMVLALAVFAIKGSGLGNATALPGIWLFALAALLSIAAARMLEGRGEAGA